MKKLDIWEALVEKEKKSLASKYGLTLLEDNKLLSETELDKLPVEALGVTVVVGEKDKKVLKDKKITKVKKPIKKTVRRYNKKIK